MEPAVIFKQIAYDECEYLRTFRYWIMIIYTGFVSKQGTIQLPGSAGPRRPKHLPRSPHFFEPSPQYFYATTSQASQVSAPSSHPRSLEMIKSRKGYPRNAVDTPPDRKESHSLPK